MAKSNWTNGRTRDQVLRMVGGYTSGLTVEQRDLVADRCIATGECVWHSAAQCFGTACYCQDCRPDVKRMAGGR